MFNQFVKRPVFFCGGGVKNNMKKLVSFWRASFFILNFVHTVISEKMVYTIENNGCVPNKVQVIPECCLLLCAYEQTEGYSQSKGTSAGFPKSGVTCFWTEALGKSQISEYTSENIFFRIGWEGRTWVYFLIFTAKTPWNSNAFFRIWGSNCSMVYIHFIGKIIESESYKRNHVLISI